MANMGEKTRLDEIQTVNTSSALNSLNSARTILDRLILNRSEVTEIRGLRNRISGLISEVHSPVLNRFRKMTGTPDEFFAAEKIFVERLMDLAQGLELHSKDGVDIKTITDMVDAAEDALHNRIPLTDALKKLYMEISPELNLYLNALQTKYASFMPEVLHTGDYVQDAGWDYRAGDKFVSARLSGGSALKIEARWHDNSKALVEQVQREAEAVKKNQFMCLCLVNTAWSKESKDFVSRFNHPRLALYLYELNGELFYNRENAAARHYEFWFSTEQEHKALKERAFRFIEQHEYFTAKDAAEVLGLNGNGADRLLTELEKQGTVIDVSLKSDKTRKYTKAKTER